MNNNETNNLPGPAIGEIVRMIERRDKAKALMEQAIDVIAQAQRIAPQYAYESALSNSVSWYSDNIDKNKAVLRRALDRKCWASLLARTKLGSVMNAKQLEKVREDIEEHAPELTHNRAMTTFMDMYVSKEEIFRSGLVDVFKSLSGNFKSHDAFKIQRRLILMGALSTYGWSSHSVGRDRLNDLWHYMSLLDGHDPTQVPYDEQPASIIEKGSCNGVMEFEFDYFRIKTYLNGNVHIWLDKRPDLISEVNKLIAEHYGSTLPC